MASESGNSFMLTVHVRNCTLYNYAFVNADCTNLLCSTVNAITILEGCNSLSTFIYCICSKFFLIPGTLPAFMKKAGSPCQDLANHAPNHSKLTIRVDNL